MDQKLINVLMRIAESLERIEDIAEAMVDDEIYEDSSVPEVYLSGKGVSDGC